MLPKSSLIRLLFSALTILHCAFAAPFSNNTFSSFAGSNNYFLHGLSVEEQTTYVQTLAGWGAKVVRLWVTGTSGSCVKGSLTTNISNLELEGSIGTYHTEVLAALDDTLKLLHENGMKAIISPHDAGVINGVNGCDAYCKKYTNQENFYTNKTARSEYDNRLTEILSYVSPNFGKPWSQLSDVILAFDIQNEPMINAMEFLEMDDPMAWFCGRATVMKDLIGSNSSVKVATGGIGGSEYCCDHEYNIIDSVLDCSAIDIISVHGYMTEASQWEYFIPSLVETAANKSKHLMIEEWGVSASPTGQFDEQVAVLNDNGVPWLYWEIVPGCDETQNCSGTCSTASNGYDSYEIGLNSSKGDVKSAIASANNATAMQDWTATLAW
ncbi:MAG: hypothetical protein M1834_000159 [Cirrosporium novae-zelandiae]|nr:MAG: hypothetical protein M1834_000159 [Cirrosporium novae-zelandiae]